MAEDNLNPTEEGSVDGSVTNEEVSNVISPLDIPDDEFDSYIRDNMSIINEPGFEEETSGDTEEEDDTNPDDTDTNEESDDTSEENDTDEESDDTSEENDTDEDLAAKDTSTDVVKDTDDTKEVSSDDKVSLNFEDEHKKLLSPFRANNRDIQVKNVDEARKLMQMGANYNKKMGALKPVLKLVKMLENNDLLTEEKLSYLIDLDKKNPDAITKLIQDSKLDVDLIDTKAENGYKPNTYTVDDTEVDISLALEDIKDSPSFNDTVDIIGNKWDESSKRSIRDNPNLIKVINEHVETGIYKTITDAVENRRMLGELSGISDLDAYQQVGSELRDSGIFNPKDQNTSENTKDVSTTKKKSDASRVSRKKSASSTKGTPQKKENYDYNPLSLSDEEFDKLAESINL